MTEFISIGHDRLCDSLVLIKFGIDHNLSNRAATASYNVHSHL